MGNRRATARNLLYTFTVLFWLCGAVLIALGVFLLVQLSRVPLVHILHIESQFPLYPREYAGAERPTTTPAPGSGAAKPDDPWKHLLATELCFGSLLALGLGVLTLLVGVLACCAAALTSRVLNSFLIFFLVLFIGIEIAGAVFVGIMSAKVFLNKDLSSKQPDTLHPSLDNVFRSYYDLLSEFRRPRVEFGFDRLQLAFQCCGVNGTSDYHVRSKIDFPLSCCKLAPSNAPLLMPPYHYPPGCPTNLSDAISGPHSENAFSRGCYEPLREWLLLQSIVIMGTLAGVLLVELLELAFSIVFCVRMCQSPYAVARADARAEAKAAGAAGEGEGELLVQAHHVDGGAAQNAQGEQAAGISPNEVPA